MKSPSLEASQNPAGQCPEQPPEGGPGLSREVELSDLQGLLPVSAISVLLSHCLYMDGFYLLRFTVVPRLGIVF